MDTAQEQARQHFLDGIGHFESGRLEPARACFEASLALAPGRASVLENLGVTLYRLNQWQAAAVALQQAATTNPEHEAVWITLGLCHQALAQWPEAADALARGLALTAGRGDLWMICGQCLDRAGRVEEALHAFDRALAIDADLAEAWSERGSLLRDLGRLEEAVPCFEQAIARGADPELNAYYLAAVRGASNPAAPPRQYVETLFDQYSADFQSHLVDQLQYRGHEWLLRPLLATRKRYPTVLDLGCGTGLCGALVAPFADAIDGVDLSAAMLAQAQQLGIYRQLSHEDIEIFLTHTKIRADLVLAADVFIYVGALEAVFSAVRRMLAPGGCFAFTVELAADADDFRLLPSLRYAHSEAYIRRLGTAHGFKVRDMQRAPLRQNQQAALDALYVYLD